MVTLSTASIVFISVKSKFAATDVLSMRMESMSKQYVEQRDGGYRVAGTSISLDSIVYSFLDGQTAEGIAQAFPLLTLEQVYGALAFYLANQSDIDAYLQQARADFESLRQAARDDDPMFYQKLADARRREQRSVTTAL